MLKNNIVSFLLATICCQLIGCSSIQQKIESGKFSVITVDGENSQWNGTIDYVKNSKPGNVITVKKSIEQDEDVFMVTIQMDGHMTIGDSNARDYLSYPGYYYAEEKCDLRNKKKCRITDQETLILEIARND